MHHFNLELDKLEHEIKKSYENHKREMKLRESLIDKNNSIDHNRLQKMELHVDQNRLYRKIRQVEEERKDLERLIKSKKKNDKEVDDLSKTSSKYFEFTTLLS